MGHPPDHIFLTSGMILKPKFYEKTTVNRVAERQRLGLEPDCPTGIVLFGGHGSHVMVDITKKLDESDSGVQLILICGHNQKLAAELKKLPTRKPTLVVGFAQNVEYYMALADFFIGSRAQDRSARLCNSTCLSSWTAIPVPCRKSATTRNGLQKKVMGSSCRVSKQSRPLFTVCSTVRRSVNSVRRPTKVLQSGAVRSTRHPGEVRGTDAGGDSTSGH